MKGLAALLLLCSVLAEGPITHQLEDIKEEDEVIIPRGIRVRVEQVEDSSIAEVWVVGRLPTDKIIVEEGRYGDREKRKDLPGKPWVQHFTFLCGHCRPGEIIDVEFWLINPYYAEQYFNDRQSYIQQHGKEPAQKVVHFKVIRRDEI